jgi:hypothetical protein
LSKYRFIADDLVLMDHDFKIYDNPAAVSVKENAWSVIETYYKEFSTLKASKIRKGQTKIKFLPMHALQNNTPKSFEIDALIWVRFSNDQVNSLSQLEKKQALYRLISDTWINPKLVSAKAFADWVLSIKTYLLEYNNFNIAKKLLDGQLQ